MAASRNLLTNLRVKITIYILIGAVVFSGVIILVTSHFLRQTLTDSLVNQGRIVASSIAELAAEKLIEEDQVGLKKISEKYRYYLSNEYIIIVDADYNIITDTYNGNVPGALRDGSVFQDVDLAGGGQFVKRLTTVDEREVYDIILPIEEGLLGYVRIGLKKAYVDEQIQNTLFYIGVIIVIGTLAAILVALMIITVQVTRPVIHLANAAEEISLGNFDTPVNLNINNELQMLAAAIDRMRESLKSSLERLKTRSTIGRF
ncbi:MAG: HAMP domain-containing protein [Calditrichaeota bacterium]|nr:HAMP domain-containing protein [Calditrichota bacterium]MCB0303078.1 HAMP domain-containing protein [Calditrichota bacterium]MCB0312811.1 HAMP domain-containing protein [Calditrichota bacterium]MCB9088387.1 HAMP domain-containing protein [Calditrichia bacterium]